MRYDPDAMPVELVYDPDTVHDRGRCPQGDAMIKTTIQFGDYNDYNQDTMLTLTVERHRVVIAVTGYHNGIYVMLDHELTNTDKATLARWLTLSIDNADE